MPLILVADDNDQVRALLARILKRTGYEVLEARNGEDALHLYSQRPADLVITDIFMPEKEGLETIRELRQRHANVRIIAMSGGGRGSARDLLNIAQVLGAESVLAKPFTTMEVLDAVDRVLKG